jgi:hypothetical protein
MGEEPQGIIMYTPDSYMSAQLMRPGRPQFVSGDWFRGSDEEIKEEALGYIAYSGRSTQTRKNRPLRIPCLYRWSQTGFGRPRRAW